MDVSGKHDCGIQHGTAKPAKLEQHMSVNPSLPAC